ncbi:hypothetical protein [Niallia sp. 03133]|uniref:hypothetical protein n=1 Tax=Niallia sp. 03133 TaxID=3458060 RepID=UPI0040441607
MKLVMKMMKFNTLNMEKKENVFCVKCCSFNKKTEDNYITCNNCNTLLDVTTRYSKRLEAYLGFINGGNRRVI